MASKTSEIETRKTLMLSDLAHVFLPVPTIRSLFLHAKARGMTSLQ